MNNSIRIIIVGLFLCGASEAFGCGCIFPTPSKGFDMAQAVFTGTIVKSGTAEWTVSVDRVWKGDVHAQIILRDSLPGTSCESGFEQNVRYLFLTRVENTEGSTIYFPDVCNWSPRLKYKKLRSTKSGRRYWTEDLVLMGRGKGKMPIKG